MKKNVRGLFFFPALRNRNAWNRLTVCNDSLPEYFSDRKFKGRIVSSNLISKLMLPFQKIISPFFIRKPISYMHYSGSLISGMLPTGTLGNGIFIAEIARFRFHWFFLLTFNGTR